MSADRGSVRGIVLAAGAGTRMGSPKALLRDEAGVPWLHHAVDTLLEAGCIDVVVVLGAHAADAAGLLPPGARALVAADWRDGLSASLRVALDDAGASEAIAAMITLVDLPTQTAAAARRVLESGVDESSLARAVYLGTPGHPVLIGRAHWAALESELDGDRGASGYLTRHAAAHIECGDLGDGEDQDTPRPRIARP